MTARLPARAGRLRAAAAATAAVLSVLALGATGCSAGHTSTNSAPGSGVPTNSAGFVAGDGTVKLIAAADRTAAPTLTGTTLDGKKLTVGGEDARGHIVVLNVWGSWCPPCRKEAPELQEAYERLRKDPPKGVDRVDFVGIDTRDEDPSPGRAFTRSRGITYPSLYDPKGQLLLGFAGSLPPTAIPSTLIIDTHGKVAARVIGATTATTVAELVREVGTT